MNLLTKQRDSETENEFMIARGERIARDFGKVMYTLLYFKWITNRDLLYSTGNSAQCHVVACMGGGFEGEWIYV